MSISEKNTPERIAAWGGASRPPHSGKIKRLPPELRAEFERRLVEGRFSDYRGLSRWLSEHGYYISHTSLHRYGNALEHKLNALKLATEQARAVVDASGGADDTVNEGLMRLVQGDLFRVLVELKEVDPEKVDVNALARNVASICRSSVQMRRAAEEMRSGIGRRVLAAERKVVAAARRGSQGGLSATAEKRIRAALLEIAELPMAAGGARETAAHPRVGEKESDIEAAPGNVGEREVTR
ncbi:MAG TPA: phage protein Gp27 family protein [Candidatus Binataceae bacterium]|nr:phage protein Gp27 family protein [Candidatus Binataceae bacterium]